MLIKCPECELQASDKAANCPHCGYPFQQSVKSKSSRKYNKRKRLPNGFGQISELKGRNLRNPFRAMITVSKDEKGKPICELLKPIAYFSTYNDAYAALLEYNKNPYDLDKAITVKDLYDRWSKGYFCSLSSDSSVRGIETSWRYCSAIYDMRVSEIRARHIKGCMEEGTRVIYGKERKPTAHMKARIKSMFNMMLDYALEYELVDKNYARTFNISDDIAKETNVTKKKHITFTDEEMNILWDNINVPFVDLIVIQCYSGWRPQEMGLIELANVDLENWTFYGGIKTDAGIDRTVPIHTKIRELVQYRYDEAVSLKSKYLFNVTDSNGLKLTYKKYSWRFSKAIEELNLNPEHRAHDPRKQFVSMAKKYGVDEYAIKYMVGHVITDITEKVYTNRDDAWLSFEIEKIK